MRWGAIPLPLHPQKPSTTCWWSGTWSNHVKFRPRVSVVLVGMITTGKVETLGPFPAIKAGTFQNCNRQTGTNKLK